MESNPAYVAATAFYSQFSNLILRSESSIKPHMPVTLSLKKMTKLDKLRAMEDIWTDLTNGDANFEVPSWHLKALQETEEQIKKGKVKFVGWDEAKRSIRRRAK